VYISNAVCLPVVGTLLAGRNINHTQTHTHTLAYAYTQAYVEETHSFSRKRTSTHTDTQRHSCMHDSLRVAVAALQARGQHVHSHQLHKLECGMLKANQIRL